MPLLFVGSELLMNKIRTPWHHVIYSFLLTLLYFLVSFGMELLLQVAVYPGSLNFLCRNNTSYKLTPPTNGTDTDVKYFITDLSKPDDAAGCAARGLKYPENCGYLQDYYCEGEGELDGLGQFDAYKNRN